MTLHIPYSQGPQRSVKHTICSAHTLSALIVLMFDFLCACVAENKYIYTKCNSFQCFRELFSGRIPACFITILRLSFIHSSREYVKAKKAFRPAESGQRRLNEGWGLWSDRLKKVFIILQGRVGCKGKINFFCRRINKKEWWNLQSRNLIQCIVLLCQKASKVSPHRCSFNA